MIGWKGSIEDMILKGIYRWRNPIKIVSGMGYLRIIILQDEHLPMLCARQMNLCLPKVLETQVGFYKGWIGGPARLTPPMQGRSLTSLDKANAVCQETFGDGWEMAEFHHVCGGWSWWALGDIPLGQRFWVSTNDQYANPWDTRTGRAMTWVRLNRENH